MSVIICGFFKENFKEIFKLTVIHHAMCICVCMCVCSSSVGKEIEFKEFKGT